MQSDYKSQSYALLFNALSDGVIVIDQSGVIRFLNYATQLILGLDHKAIGSKIEDTIYMQFNGSAIGVEELPFYRVLRDKTVFTTNKYPRRTYTVARNDRTILPVNMTILPLSLGTEDGVTVVFHDQSSDEKIDRAKSEFVALVSHQLRTPVNIISWYVEELLNQRRGSLNEGQLDYLREVYKGNRRIIELVQAIINVSRTDLNKIKHKHEAISFRRVAQRIIAELQPSMQERAIRFTASFADEDYTLNDSDQELVGVTIRNVLSNAIRYSSEHGSVGLSAHWVTEGSLLDPETDFTAIKPGVVVVVRDEGMGIPDEDKLHIFSKLYRGSSVQALDVTGVGLGLYIAKSFIEELGGHIWFVSEVRQGTTFYMYFPS